MTTDYVTVFEISQPPSAELFPALPLGLISLIAGIVIVLAKKRLKWRNPQWSIPVYLCGFGLIYLFTAAISALPHHSLELNDYRLGNYQQIEGKVEDFRPMPYGGHQEECFSVHSTRFCYSDNVWSPGFRNTASHGGPIRLGLPVRIAYFGGTILRLDIPKDRVLTPAQSAAIARSVERQRRAQMENEPLYRQIGTAFFFTVVCWTLYWNLRWKTMMKFWVRPPNRPWVQLVFRTFFALDFLGAVTSFVQDLKAHPLENQNIRSTIVITILMCFVIFLMTSFGLWSMRRRQQTKDEHHTSIVPPATHTN